jgi:pyruvate dehydrogenase E2 component (dihydrolipoamide acetyltransferase)
MSVREVTVPDIGDFADVPIIEVLVEPGQTVAPEDPLVTLESDKATMDVPAPFAGVVQELKVAVGDTVSEGSALLTLEAEGPAPSADGASAEREAPGDTSAPAADAAAPAEAGAPAAVETAAVAEDSADSTPPAPPPAADAPSDGPVYASPAVRRLARERGIDLAAVTGTGRKGRITKADVETVAEGAPAAPAPAPAAAPPAADGAGLGLLPWPVVDFEKFGPVERVPRSRIQNLSAANLHRNWVMIPHVTHHEEADVTELEAFRKRTNEEHAKQGVRMTMVALLLKACIPALQRFPQFNASLDGDDLVLKRYYHLGFAADTPGGLVVPVIRDVDQKGLLEIAAELGELSGRAREGKLKPAEMQGGTFSISSLGGIGGTAFTPIVNAPEVAILGVSRSARRPVWDGTGFVPRLILPLSLSYDHRVIDGAAAARFAAYLAGVLNDLRRGLL